MKKYIYLVLLFFPILVIGQTDSENYIKSTVYLNPTEDGNNMSSSEKIESITYFDGLGRPIQQIALKAGGNQQTAMFSNWQQDWSAGEGSTEFYTKNGQTSENNRIYGEAPNGENTLLWECGNDVESNADGGWNTDFFNIDNTKAYVYTVWMKRTGSATNGRAYHGTKNVTNLNGVPNSNPYFMSFFPPATETWYLLVGIVHPKDYNGGNSGISGVYDLEGNKLIDGNEFKWDPAYSTTRMRNYLYYCTDVNTRQYFWNPVLKEINDSLPVASELVEESMPKNLVTPIEYDEYGRQLKEYLPYPSSDDSMQLQDPNALMNELNSYYSSEFLADIDVNAPNPYSEKEVETSPLSRLQKQAAPGQAWKLGGDHEIRMEYLANTTEDAVRYFSVAHPANNTENISLIDEGYYTENLLRKTITKDENWQSGQVYSKDHTTEEYTNKEGQVLLKRTFNEGQKHDTYYIYDDFRNLTYVLSPKASENTTLNQAVIDGLGYQYKYDHRNRLVEKKIPGKDWEYIVYDILDRPVLTQDANLRTQNKWLFTKYDGLGRVAYTGIYTQGGTRAEKQAEANGYRYPSNFEVRSSSINNIGSDAIYYSNRSFPEENITILTINYYDDYEIGNQITFNPANNVGTWEGMFTSTKTKGLPTVSRVKVLDTNQWITTASYYDDKGRAWETHIKNEYLASDDWGLNQLDFTGRVLKSKAIHIKGGETTTIIDNFSYDHIGRVTTHTQQINDQETELLARNSYDPIGQLISKGVGNTEGAPLQQVDYNYNIRGWLKTINEGVASGNDLFGFALKYNDPTNGTALYNGNISQTLWQTQNTDPTLKKYTYSYDALNRLTDAVDNTGNYSLSGVAYDANGNITALKRQGHTNPEASNFGMMDDLVYSYDAGNKLISVLDNGNDNHGFKDGNTTGADYSYDANGNMISDKNKDITSISYNHLNLPKEIAFGSGSQIEYYYDAAGMKLRKVVTDEVSGGVETVTDYVGGYVYQSVGQSSPESNMQLQFMEHSEGYVEPDGNGGYEYTYQYKDHLGNIRLSYSDLDGNGVISAQAKIKEENNYYPFGLKHKGYNNLIVGRDHNYGYNGKEEQNELNLNWSDYGARNYDASLGRWMNIDPLAERYTNFTPYNYVANTPLQAIDPDGRAIIFIGGLRFLVGAGDQGGSGGGWPHRHPWIYRYDVFDYWSTNRNSFGKSTKIDRLFMKAYNDKNVFYLSGSSTWDSSADRRQTEGRRKAERFHELHGYGSNNSQIKKGEAIRVVSHSQGGAHAAGFVSQLLTYKDEEGNNLYNVEVIWYLNPHQPGDIENPEGVESIQYSVTSDQISGGGWMSLLGLNGGSEYAEIEGAQNNYMSVFRSGEEGSWTGRRGGHNVNDGEKNIILILNKFCRENPDKCQEIKLKKTEK